MIKTHEQIVLPAVPLFANIYTPRNDFGRDRYGITWMDGIQKANAKSALPPLVTLADGHGYDKLKLLFDECDVRNVPRCRCFLGVKLQLRVTPYEYDVDGRQGISFFLEEIIVSRAALEAGYGAALDRRRR